LVKRERNEGEKEERKVIFVQINIERGEWSSKSLLQSEEILGSFFLIFCFDSKIK